MGAVMRWRGGAFCVAMTDPCTATERAVLLGWLFALGRRMTAAEVAEMLGVKDRRARSLLNEVSRVIPIYRDDDGLWTICTETALPVPPDVP